MDTKDNYTHWEIEERDGTKRPIIFCDDPIDKEDQKWGRRYLVKALIGLFTIAFLASLVYAFITSDYQPLDWVWRTLGPALGVTIGYYFAPRR